MRVALFVVYALLFLGAAIGGTLLSFNFFGKVERSFAGQCTPVRGIAGSEDIVLDAKRRLAFISSLDRRAEGARGGVHVLDLADPLSSDWKDMTAGAPAAFRPLGMDYFEEDGLRRLFVVNEATSSVDLFDVTETGGLVYLESFTERRLTSPNNVVAVGPRSFYVTNDVKPGRASLLGRLHFLTRQGSGQVLFSNGTSWRLAAEGLRFANGVDISKDGAQLYVAETSGKAVKVFDAEPLTGSLTLADTIPLPASPDNVTVDAKGDLWVAALPKPLSLPRIAANPDARAPSAVYRIGGEGSVETVYRDDGAEISGSTAAAHLGRNLLIGGLYEKKFLICELPERAF